MASGKTQQNKFFQTKENVIVRLYHFIFGRSDGGVERPNAEVAMRL